VTLKVTNENEKRRLRRLGLGVQRSFFAKMGNLQCELRGLNLMILNSTIVAPATLSLIARTAALFSDFTETTSRQPDYRTR
jgi:hypothetical protein